MWNTSPSHHITMGKKKDKEFGSQANLVKNEEKGPTRDDSIQNKRANLSRTQSRTSEFETVMIKVVYKGVRNLSRITLADQFNTKILEVHNSESS